MRAGEHDGLGEKVQVTVNSLQAREHDIVLVRAFESCRSPAAKEMR